MTSLPDHHNNGEDDDDASSPKDPLLLNDESPSCSQGISVEERTGTSSAGSPDKVRSFAEELISRAASYHRLSFLQAANHPEEEEEEEEERITGPPGVTETSEPLLLRSDDDLGGEVVVAKTDGDSSSSLFVPQTEPSSSPSSSALGGPTKETPSEEANTQSHLTGAKDPLESSLMLLPLLDLEGPSSGHDHDDRRHRTCSDDISSVNSSRATESSAKSIRAPPSESLLGNPAAAPPSWPGNPTSPDKGGASSSSPFQSSTGETTSSTSGEEGRRTIRTLENVPDSNRATSTYSEQARKQTGLFGYLSNKCFIIGLVSAMVVVLIAVTTLVMLTVGPGNENNGDTTFAMEESNKAPTMASERNRSTTTAPGISIGSSPVAPPPGTKTTTPPTTSPASSPTSPATATCILLKGTETTVTMELSGDISGIPDASLVGAFMAAFNQTEAVECHTALQSVTVALGSGSVHATAIIALTSDPTPGPSTSPMLSSTSGAPTTGNPNSDTPTEAPPTTVPSPPIDRGSTLRPATTISPTTGSPTRSRPVTASPILGTPTTGIPTTGSPTQSPTTESPRTASPMTTSPTTTATTTASPTTLSPATSSPTTLSLATGDPTTASPTTGSPTTGSPTTASPTAGSPTTPGPTTASPTAGSPMTSSSETGSPIVGFPAITESPVPAPPNTSSCDYASDTCHYQFDGECDAGVYCSSNTDCFDCDECGAFNYDCGGCIAAGCYWCPGDAICSSSPIGPSVWNLHPHRQPACREEGQWQQQCSTSNDNNFFTDPLYNSMSWMYKLIKVEEVWAQGFTGVGIHVRVNSNGVDANHVEFAQNFDKTNSCASYLPNNFTTDTHGTGFASIIAGNKNNGACAVGIAPDATLSACQIPQTLPGTTEIFNTHLDAVDVISNSWGPRPCRNTLGGARQPHLRQQECPFDHHHPQSPCRICGTTAFSQVQTPECENAITQYCSMLYENDPVACGEYLDLYVECEFHSLSPINTEGFAQVIADGRGGLGPIITFSGGNDYKIGVDSNDDGMLNSRYTIGVAAVGKDGLHASYSTTGAAIFVSAPGGDKEAISNNIVAKPGGGCHNMKGRTGYATPVVSAITALMLQANPSLGWRDVQGILAVTSQRVDFEDPSWQTNRAGISHSTKYGFGLIDASAAVASAQTWENWGSEKQIMKESGVINVAIPDATAKTGSSRASALASLTITQEDVFKATGINDMAMESVVIYLDLQHGSRGDLQIILTSPGGTKSILAPSKRPENTVLENDERWKLMTLKKWGENPIGTWTLEIADEKAGVISNCANILWEYSLDDGTVVNCGDLARINITDCSAQVPLEGQQWEFNGKTIMESCCICGGGLDATTIDQRLRSWRMVTYGHLSDPPTPLHTATTEIPTPASPTTSPPTTASPTANKEVVLLAKYTVVLEPGTTCGNFQKGVCCKPKTVVQASCPGTGGAVVLGDGVGVTDSECYENEGSVACKIMVHGSPKYVSFGCYGSTLQDLGLKASNNGGFYQCYDGDAVYGGYGTCYKKNIKGGAVLSTTAYLQGDGCSATELGCTGGQAFLENGVTKCYSEGHCMGQECSDGCNECGKLCLVGTGGSGFGVEAPTGMDCVETYLPAANGESCEHDFMCQSNICVGNRCQAGPRADNDQCNENHHCESGACGLPDAGAASKICCEEAVEIDFQRYCRVGLLEKCFGKEMCHSKACGVHPSAQYGYVCCAETVLINGVEWCMLENGEECTTVNERCKSSVCVDGICLDPVEDLGLCEDDGDCQSGVCGILPNGFDFDRLCCPNGSTYTKRGITYCADLPAGHECDGMEEVCAGYCINGECSNERLQSLAVCEEDDDCVSGTCASMIAAASDGGPSSRVTVCCPTSDTLQNLYHYCTNLPEGSNCELNRDAVCSSEAPACIQGKCSGLGADGAVGCLKNEDCRSGACAYSDYKQAQEGIIMGERMCCKDGGTVDIRVFVLGSEAICTGRPAGTACGLSGGYSSYGEICASGSCVKAGSDYICE